MLSISFPELFPLIEKVEPLQHVDSAEDVFVFVRNLAKSARTPPMAQSACAKVISMCHPRAWGDRYISNNQVVPDWMKFLAELEDVANDCAQRIYEANRP